MGRRSSWQFKQHEKERQEAKRMNPVWRGVGCLLVVAIGAIGFLLANWFLVQNQINSWVYLPPQVINPSGPAFWNFALAPLRGGNLVRIVMALLFMLTAFAIINFIYAILFPVQPGEYDLPTPRRGRRRRR